VIFEVRGLPKDRSFLQSPWDKKAKTTMDTFCGIQIGVTVHCENGYVANNKAFDRTGKLIKELEPTNPDMNSNFIKVLRTRKVENLEGDILQGHLSAALVHMANISYRLGKTAAPGEIRERIRGRRGSLDAYERFQAHLAANGIDLDKTRATLGPLLTMDSNTERFTGEFATEANKLVTREYRAPFVVPVRV
jgi:hypothetical protein